MAGNTSAASRRAGRAAPRVVMTEATAPAVPIIRTSVGSTLVVDVDIEHPSVNYTVAFDSRTLMYSQVDRREAVENLEAGTHRLVWSFTHLAKGWQHRVSAQVTGQPRLVLEERSEAKKDSPYSLGFALVVAS